MFDEVTENGEPALHLYLSATMAKFQGHNPGEDELILLEITKDAVKTNIMKRDDHNLAKEDLETHASEAKHAIKDELRRLGDT